MPLNKKQNQNPKLLILYKYFFRIKLPTKVDMPLNKNQNQVTKFFLNKSVVLVTTFLRDLP